LLPLAMDTPVEPIDRDAGLFLVAPDLVTEPEPESQQEAEQTLIQEAKPELKQPAISENEDKGQALHENVVRAVLTTDISDKEPVDEVSLPLIIDAGNTLKIYYFTELIDMQGHIFHHQWLFEGAVVYKRPFKVRANRW